jgi:transcriptional regulator with XRE-family HTH domain
MVVKEQVEQTGMRRFGEKLRTLRRNHGITLQALAHDLGYADHTFLSRVERGEKKPSTELIIAVAQKFNVKTDLLLMDDIDI